RVGGESRLADPRGGTAVHLFPTRVRAARHAAAHSPLARPDRHRVARLGVHVLAIRRCGGRRAAPLGRDLRDRQFDHAASPRHHRRGDRGGSGGGGGTGDGDGFVATYVRPWLNPFTLSVGLFAVVAFAF